MRTALDALGEGVHGSVQTFVDAMMAEFGGPVALAKELHLEYEHFPRGSQTRTRIIDAVLRLLERYGTSVGDDVPKLETLQRELEALLADGGDDVA